MKYYGRNKEHKTNLDSLLMSNIPIAINADKNTFHALILKLISETNDSITYKTVNPHIGKYALIDNSWMCDTTNLNSEIGTRLSNIFNAHTGGDNYFVYNRHNEGTIRTQNELTYSEFNDSKIRLLGLFRFWNLINYFYPAKLYTDTCWDRALYKSIDLFKKADTEIQYRKEIYNLLSYLNDTHSCYPLTVDGKVLGPYRPNFRMTKVDDSFLINEFRVPSNDSLPAQIGDIVISINGKPAKELYDSLKEHIKASNILSTQRFVCSAMLSFKDSVTIFKILRKSDTLTLRTNNEMAWDQHQKKMKIEKTLSEKPLSKWINDSVAYFDLRYATSGNFNRNFNQIKTAKTIILDLRGYPDTKLITKISDHFVPPTPLFAYVVYADSRFPGLLRYHKSSRDVGHEKYFKGKIIVLINELTESYSEYVTMLLQTNPNVVTVGTLSSGSDGNISTFAFPGDIKVIYSGIGIHYPDLSPAQRVGLKINHPISLSAKSIINGDDPWIDRAVEIATKKTS